MGKPQPEPPASQPLAQPPPPSALEEDAPDKVQEASEESYPASDPPAWIAAKVA